MKSYIHALNIFDWKFYSKLHTFEKSVCDLYNWPGKGEPTTELLWRSCILVFFAGLHKLLLHYLLWLFISGDLVTLNVYNNKMTDWIGLITNADLYWDEKCNCIKCSLY